MSRKPLGNAIPIAINKYINTAYDTVLLVAQNLDVIKAVADQVTYLNTYLGESDTPPTKRPNGDPLESGDFYYDDKAVHYYEASDQSWTKVDPEELKAAAQTALDSANIAVQAKDEAVEAADKAKSYTSGTDIGDYTDNPTFNVITDYVVYGRGTAGITLWKVEENVTLPYTVNSTAYPHPSDDPNLRAYTATAQLYTYEETTYLTDGQVIVDAQSELTNFVVYLWDAASGERHKLDIVYDYTTNASNQIVLLDTYPVGSKLTIVFEDIGQNSDTYIKKQEAEQLYGDHTKQANRGSANAHPASSISTTSGDTVEQSLGKKATKEELNEGITASQNDIIGSSIFKGSNGETVEVGDTVELGITHLRVLVGGVPNIVEMSPASSGSVVSLTDYGADIGGVDVKFISIEEDKKEILASRLGLVFNSSSDQSQLLIDAINTCNQENAKLYIPKGKFIKANISTDGISVFIVGGGEIRPFAKTSPTLFLKGGFDDAFNVSSVQTVTEVVTPLHGAATLTKLSVPAHNFTVNDIAKVVSEDLIPSCLVSDGTRNGEWASVYAVNGDDVYLNRVLDNTYTTSPRVARIKDLTCELDITLDGEETATAAKQLISVVAFKEPKGNLVMKNNGGAGCYMISNYRPVFSYSAKNLADDPSNLKYGYGMDDIGNAFALFINPYGEKCRHAYTTGRGGASQDIDNYGESYKSVVKFGVAVNCTNTAWDTHSQGDGVTFVGCKSDGNRASYVSRCKNVQWLSCDYGDCNVGFRVLNVTDEDFASGEAIDCSGSGDADIPFSVTAQGTGRSKLLVDGGSFNFRLSTSPLQFNKAHVEFKNKPKLKTKDTSTNFQIAQIIDSDVYMDGGRIDLSTVSIASNGIFQLNGNSSFVSTEVVEIPVLSSNGDLFMTTDPTNTASVNGKIKTNSINKARQVDGINGDVEILIIDDEVEQNSTGYQSVSIDESSPIEYLKPLDQNVYLRITTASLGSQPSAVVDGSYPGQQCCFHNLVGGQLTISDTLSNVLVGAVIQVGEAKIATWQPAGWVFS